MCTTLTLSMLGEEVVHNVYILCNLHYSTVNMASQKNEPRNHSTNDSENQISSRILESLRIEHVQGPKTLLKNVDCAPATLYKYLKPLEKKRQVISNKIGREMFYALPENYAELYEFTRMRTLLEDHVIKNAHRFIEEIVQVGFDKKEQKRIDVNSSTLSSAVDALRKTHPRLPFRPPLRKYRLSANEISTPREVKEYLDSPLEFLSVKLGRWYDYWIEVLQILEES